MANPIIPTWMLYLASVADNLRIFSYVVIVICAVVIMVSLNILSDSLIKEKDQASCFRALGISGIVLLVFLLIVILIPSQQDMQDMITNRVTMQQSSGDIDNESYSISDAIRNAFGMVLRPGDK